MAASSTCDDCSTQFSVYKDCQHIRKAEGNGNKILGGIGEFCAAFFHVPRSESTRMDCLNEEDCIIARTGRRTGKRTAQPTSAVAFVKYESESGESEPGVSEPGGSEPGESEPGESEPGESEPGVSEPGESEPGESEPGESEPGVSEPGESEPGESESGESESVLYLKRYTNCYDQQMHAEEFFCLDINPEISEDRELINAIYGERRVKKITMFITMQPCHLSTLGTEGTRVDQSCCRRIVEAIAGLPDDVQICIKPTHLCKAGWKKVRIPQERVNAELGLKELINGRIKVSSMVEADWTFLWEHVEPPIKGRAQLDVEISEFLQTLGQSHNGVDQSLPDGDPGN